MFGLALYNGVIIGVNFPQLLYKKLLGKTPTAQDFEALFPEHSRGFAQLLAFDGDVESVFCLSFEVLVETFEEKKSVHLKENGASISVTQENRAGLSSFPFFAQTLAEQFFFIYSCRIRSALHTVPVR